jgi:hypothetical protein
MNAKQRRVFVRKARKTWRVGTRVRYGLSRTGTVVALTNITNGELSTCWPIGHSIFVSVKSDRTQSSITFPEKSLTKIQ